MQKKKKKKNIYIYIYIYIYIQVYLYSAFYDTIVAKRFTGIKFSTIYLYIVET